MQPVGFNASPFSFQRKTAVPFSAQANTVMLQQAPQSDEVLFGTGQGIIKKGNLTSQSKIKIKSTKKLKRQATFLQNKLSQFPEIPKPSIPKGHTVSSSKKHVAIKNGYYSHLGKLSEIDQEEYHRITGSPTPESDSKANLPSPDRTTVPESSSTKKPTKYQLTKQRHRQAHDELALADGELSKLIAQGQPVPDELEDRVHQLDDKVRRMDLKYLHLVSPELNRR